MNKCLVVIGAGGHAKVLLNVLINQANIKIIGILDKDLSFTNNKFLGIEVLG